MMSQAQAATGKIEVHLFGPFHVTVDGVAVEERHWTRRKSKALVKILALAPRHQLHREQLIEHLWPEMEPETAANNLNKAIHAARRALEPGLKSGSDSRFILTHDQHVWLGAPGELWVDAEVFERRAKDALKGAAAGDYEAALEVYAGELLDEDRYEDWAAARREQLRRLADRLLLRLAELYESAGQTQPGIERLQQLLALNPSDEAAHRRLMRLYAASGSRHLALAQYQQCRDALKKELDAEPEEATVALYKQIISGHFQPAAPPTRAPAGNSGEPGKPRLQETESEVAATKTEKPSPPARRASRNVIRAALALLLFAALGAGLFYYLRREPASEVVAIAVLPFANGSADANVDYLSDGITESLINSLSRLPRLRVMARTTAFRYKGREADPQAVGAELKVQAILTGRVSQRGDELVIQADLIDARDGAQMWGERYSRKLSDLLLVQTEIAREIGEKLRLQLTREERQRATRQHTANIEAYQSYLKGRYYWNRRSVPDLQRAIEQFKRAVALDPAYAQAYSGLADAWYVLSGVHLPPREAAPRARAAALEALKLDDQLAEAHASLAMVKWRYDWDWEGAEAEFKRAIALDPNYATAHQWYGLLLADRRQFEAARAELALARSLDPLSLIISANVGLSLYFARQYDAAIAEFNRTLELDQSFAYAHRFLGWAYTQQGDYALALAAYRRMAQLDDTPGALAYLAHCQALAGDKQAARDSLTRLQEISKQRYVSPYYLAVVALGLGENGQAIDYLTQAADDRSDLMVLLGVEPRFDALRADPRFAALLRRAGLAP
jgi:DNA-binding SARP family transcriptional activator/TolB-like protein